MSVAAFALSPIKYGLQQLGEVGMGDFVVGVMSDVCKLERVFNFCKFLAVRVLLARRPSPQTSARQKLHPEQTVLHW